MARLVLINGAPGSGKSTLAAALAQDSAMILALEVDRIKHSLGRWREDPHASGLHARFSAWRLPVSTWHRDTMWFSVSS